MSGAPVSTWTLGVVNTCRTFPAKGATTSIFIFMAELVSGVNEAHRRFTPVDDSHAFKLVVHGSSHQQMVNGPNRRIQAATGSGDMMVWSALRCSALTAFGVAIVR